MDQVAGVLEVVRFDLVANGLFFTVAQGNAPGYGKHCESWPRAMFN